MNGKVKVIISEWKPKPGWEIHGKKQLLKYLKQFAPGGNREAKEFTKQVVNGELVSFVIMDSSDAQDMLVLLQAIGAVTELEKLS